MTNTSAYLTHPHRREAEAERQRCLPLPGAGALLCPSGTHLQNDWHPFPALPARLGMKPCQAFFNTRLLATLLCLVAFAQPGMSQTTILAWGSDNQYQLGQGAANGNRLTPVTASIWTGPVKVLAGGGNRTVVLKPDGTIWTWGLSSVGEAGNGGTVQNVVTPLQANISGVADIAAGYGFTLALKGDGTLWSWGHNSEGQLGVGSCCANSSIPLQVNLIGVSKIAGGYYHSLALKTDGTVWAWGRGDEGQLGNGTNLDSSSPVQVSGLTDVVAIDRKSVV